MEGHDISGQPTHYEMSLQWVKDILIDEYGTVTFDYTSKENTIYKNYMKWIKTVSLNTDTGLFEVEFNYDKTRDGEDLAKEDTKYSTYLRYIKNVQIDEDGTIHFEYTHGEEQVFDKYLKTINSITLNPENGHFEIIYNQETDTEGNPTKYEADLRWVHEVSIDEFGTITFDYTNGDDTVYTNYIKTIKSVTLDSVTGHLEIIYNFDTDAEGQPTKYETDLKWVNGLEFAEDGTVTITYTNGDKTPIDQKIKWITESVMSPDGTLTFSYNDGTTDTYEKEIQWITDITLDNTGIFTVKYNNGEADFTKTLKWPVSITVNTGEQEGEGDQKVNIAYTDGTNEEIGNAINYIMKTAISPDYHLLVLYSDPARRQAIKDQGLNATYEDRDDWYDLGYIGQGSVGAIVGKESDEGASKLAETLPPYSAWFIVEEEK